MSSSLQFIPLGTGRKYVDRRGFKNLRIELGSWTSEMHKGRRSESPKIYLAHFTYLPGYCSLLDFYHLQFSSQPSSSDWIAFNGLKKRKWIQVWRHERSVAPYLCTFANNLVKFWFIEPNYLLPKQNKGSSQASVN